MPLFDFNAAIPADHLQGHEVVVIGAGAAGILLAVKMSRKGKRVLLIESGHLKPDDDRQALNRIEETGKPFGNSIWHRKRILGGTTTGWGGQSLPFGPIDFEARDWVPQSGWPMAHTELKPWYDVANAFMQVDEWNYSSDLFEKLHCPNPGFEHGPLDYHFSKWAPEPNFFKIYRRELEQRVTVFYNAHLTKIDLGPDDRVRQITLANFVGQTKTLPVRTLVIATGGIEANRTLLLNDHQQTTGLGNRSGHLGRGFMEHPCADAGEIIPNDARLFQRSFAPHYHRRRKYSVRLSSSPEWQRTHRLLNASVTFLFSYPHRENDPFERLKSLIRRDFKKGRPTLAQLSALTKSAATLLTHGYLYKPGASVRLALMIEQEPSASSYIQLGQNTDPFGRRLAAVHWRMTELAWRTAYQFALTLRDEIARTGLGEVKFAAPFDQPSAHADVFSFFGDVNHHMGGTRMSATSAGGVVNSDLQVWGVPNLYVSSCSVFPTGSHSNPTLTMLALAARLAEKLSVSA